MGIDFLSSITTLVIAYGVQHSWLKQATKTDEVTLALARLYCAGEVAAPLVFGQDTADKVRSAPAVRDFFSDQRLYDHIAVARFGISDAAICVLAVELNRSIGATRLQLNDRTSTPAQIYHEASEQRQRCEALEGRVQAAIDAARRNASFFHYLRGLFVRSGSLVRRP